MDRNEQQGFDFSVFWHNFTRTFAHLFWLPVALCLLLGVWRYSRLVRSYSPVYETSTLYRVSSSRSGMDIGSVGLYLDSNAAVNLASSYPYVMNSDRAKELLVQLTGRTSLPATVSCRAEATLLVFTASGSDPNAVVSAIETVVQIFPEAAKTIRGGFRLEPFDVLEQPDAPINPLNPLPGTVKYALLGLAAGLALICLTAYLRKTVHNSEDLKQLLNIPCLGLLPRVRFKARTKQNTAVLLSNPQLDESYIEAVRGIRFQLRKELEHQAAKTIMVTSTSPGEGKSTVSANLALALAEQGNRVALVDCDLRKQSLKQLFGITDPTVGLADLIAGKSGSVTDALVQVSNSTLWLLSGDKVAEQPQNFLSAPRLQVIMNSLRQGMDYIIVDTPPSGILADAGTLADWVDGALYVVRQDYIGRSAIVDSVQKLSGLDIRFLGCVINQALRETNSSGFGYSARKGSGYGYGYGYGKHSYGSKTNAEESDSYRK